MSISRAHAKGVADLLEMAGRVNGRWRPFHIAKFGKIQIEYREDLPYGQRFEVTENGAARRQLATLEDAVLQVHELEPTFDLQDYTVEAR